MARLVFLTFVALFLSLTTAELHCYMPDGTVDDKGTVPCNSTAAVSACCDPKDSCTTSGLCLGASGWIYRSACTDATWTAKECPSQCRTDPILKTKYFSFAPIFPCASGVGTNEFCCGSYSQGNPNCCAKNFTLGLTGQAFKPGNDAFLAQLASASAAVSSGGAATITVTATPTAVASTSTNTAEPSASSGSNLGAAIGAGVGVPLGVLALGLLGFLFWRERRRQSDAHKMPEMQGTSVSGWSHASPGSGYGGIASTNGGYGNRTPGGTPQQHFAGAPPMHQVNGVGNGFVNKAPNAQTQPEVLHELRG